MCQSMTGAFKWLFLFRHFLKCLQNLSLQEQSLLPMVDVFCVGWGRKIPFVRRGSIPAAEDWPKTQETYRIGVYFSEIYTLPQVPPQTFVLRCPHFANSESTGSGEEHLHLFQINHRPITATGISWFPTWEVNHRSSHSTDTGHQGYFFTEEGQSCVYRSHSSQWYCMTSQPHLQAAVIAIWHTHDPHGQSMLRCLKSGIPQGSALTRLFFNIYTRGRQSFPTHGPKTNSARNGGLY